MNTVAVSTPVSGPPTLLSSLQYDTPSASVIGIKKRAHTSEVVRPERAVAPPHAAMKPSNNANFIPSMGTGIVADKGEGEDADAEGEEG